MPGKSQQEKAREESGFRPASEISEAGVNQMSESSSSVSTDVQVGFSFLNTPEQIFRGKNFKFLTCLEKIHS